MFTTDVQSPFVSNETLPGKVFVVATVVISLRITQLPNGGVTTRGRSCGEPDAGIVGLGEYL